MQMSDQNMDDSPKPTFNIGFGLAFFLVGALAGFAGLQFFLGKLPLLTEVLITASYLIFGLLIATFVIIFYFRNYLSKKLFGTSPKNVHTALQDTQKAANYVTDQITAHVLKDAPADIRDGVRALLPRLAYQLFWARLRNWWWQWILGIFIAVGGLTGTLLLMNQNELLQSQNNMIQRQMSLEEANRRSALVVLMSNILDKVDKEIEVQQKGMSLRAREATRYSLSQSLVGQIAALSHAFKPYKYMEGDTLIVKPLSPERGQLLTTLTALPLDTTTMKRIYKSATFQSADLKMAVLINAYLSSANMKEANLSHADLTYANLSDAYLSDANLSDADMRWAKLPWAILSNANLVSANLSKADLTHSTLSKADLSNADVGKANFSEANLKEATLKNIVDFKMEQASTVSSLFNCVALNDSIKVNLQKSHPHLFKDFDQ